MALTAPAPRTSDEDVTLNFYPMAAVVAYQGGIAVINSSGYVQPGTAATGLTAVGIFDFTADVMEGSLDNSGGNPGDLNARVRTGVFKFANQSGDLVVEGDVGQVCYIYDDATVCHTGTGKSVAGIVRRVETGGVFVWIGSPWTAALTAEAATRAGIVTSLASNAHAQGASLVGIEDPAGKITATTVEAALAENIDARRIALGTDGNTLPVPVCVVSKTIANASVDTNVTLDAAFGGLRVTHVVVEKAAGSSTGGNATITVKNTATAITEAMPLLNLTAGMLYRNTTIVPTAASIASGGILRITSAAGSGDAACTVTVYGYRVA